MSIMNLKVIEQSESGLITRFVNQDTGYTFSREHVIDQINNGNPNYARYHTVTNPNGTVYVRSNADGSKNNNIE